MLVLLDSNIIIADFWLSSGNSKVLLNNIHSQSIKLCIPKLVVDETVNKYREKLNEQVKNLKSVEKSLGLLINARQIFSDHMKVEALTKEYEQFLLSKLKKCGAEILEYPKVNHEHIVQRIFSKDKPFHKGEKGYRDYLIWCNLKELDKQGYDEVAFISSNFKDFSDNNDNTILHESLLKDIAEKDKVRLYNSLNEFNQERITPKLDLVQELKNILIVDGEYVASLKHWAEYDLIRELDEYDLKYVVTSLDEDDGWFSISKIELEKFEIINAKVLTTGKTRLSFSADIGIEFNVSVNSDECKRNPGFSELYDIDCNDKFGLLFFDTNDEITIYGEMILDKSNKKLETNYIEEIDGYFGSINYLND